MSGRRKTKRCPELAMENRKNSVKFDILTRDDEGLRVRIGAVTLGPVMADARRSYNAAEPPGCNAAPSGPPLMGERRPPPTLYSRSGHGYGHV